MAKTKKQAKRPKRRGEQRKVDLAVVIGAKGTGKSTFLLEMAKGISKKRKVFVVQKGTMDDTFEGYPEVNISSYDEITNLKPGIYRINYLRFKEKTFYLMWKHVHNSAIYFDDARGLFNYTLTEAQEDMFLNGRHMMSDMFYIAHDFSKVPFAMVAYITKIFLFKTTSELTNDFKKKVPNLSIVQEAKKRIDRKSKINPYYFERIIL